VTCDRDEPCEAPRLEYKPRPEEKGTLRINTNVNPDSSPVIGGEGDGESLKRLKEPERAPGSGSTGSHGWCEYKTPPGQGQVPLV